MTVRRGDYRDGTFAEVIDRVQVPRDGWIDVADVRRRANDWLEQWTRQHSKTTAGTHDQPLDPHSLRGRQSRGPRARR